MIGKIRTYDRTDIELQHSSNAVVTQFWMRLTPQDAEHKTTAALTIPDARVLIAILEKGIEEATRNE